jgi:predicted transcriptional regulator
MVTLLVDDVIAERLRQLAETENRPLEAVLNSMLNQYTTPLPTASTWAYEMAKMAEADTTIEWSEDAPDLSEQSRELLGNDFGDYLLKRMNDDGNDTG